MRHIDLFHILLGLVMHHLERPPPVNPLPLVLPPPFPPSPQLLNDMEHSPDTKHKEDSAYLLECLIGSAPRLIMPYVSPIQKALVARLRSV